jgi:hypothetical protein
MSGNNNHGTGTGAIEYVGGHAEDIGKDAVTVRTAQIQTPFPLNFSTSDYTLVAMTYLQTIRPSINNAVF